MISHNNPGKGWYRIYEFKAGEAINPSELQWSLCQEEKVALLAISLEQYRTTELDDEAVQGVKAILEFFVEHKKSMLLRFCYDRVGKGMEKEPPFLEIILSHMNALGPALEEFLPWIVQYQGLFIGNYGEMHGSKFQSKEEICMLYNTMKKYLPKVYFAMRTPALLQSVKTDEYDTLFNDGLFGSRNHMCTVKDGEEQQCYDLIKGTMVSGEVLSLQIAEQDFSSEEIIETLAAYQVCFLNSTYDKRRLEDFEEKGIYEEICKRLGYCLSLTRPHWQLRSTELEFSNTGFGIMNRRLLIQLIDKTTEAVLAEETLEDVILPGETKKIKFPKIKHKATVLVRVLDCITKEELQIYEKGKPVSRLSL